jgi:hypothetical protein
MTSTTPSMSPDRSFGSNLWESSRPGSKEASWAASACRSRRLSSSQVTSRQRPRHSPQMRRGWRALSAKALTSPSLLPQNEHVPRCETTNRDGRGTSPPMGTAPLYGPAQGRLGSGPKRRKRGGSVLAACCHAEFHAAGSGGLGREPVRSQPVENAASRRRAWVCWLAAPHIRVLFGPCSVTLRSRMAKVFSRACRSAGGSFVASVYTHQPRRPRCAS